MISILVGIGTIALLAGGLMTYINKNNEQGCEDRREGGCGDCRGCGISYEEIKAGIEKEKEDH